jgi:hypothetical protein
MASEKVQSGGDKRTDGRQAGRAAFEAWVVERLEWERLLRSAEAEEPTRSAA